jgi:carbohydrate diacid regulator
MNIKKTSEDLFIHRNTLMARLNRIKDIIGYKPQSFKDAFFIRIAIMMLNLERMNKNN